MKAIFKYLGILASVLAIGMFTSCNIQEVEDDDTGLEIKTFFPTKVVANQPMTISGSGLSSAKEVVFPNGVTVTDFETVGNGMIRLKAPRGIAAEGGNIIVRSAEEEAVSKESLSLGKTAISGYSKLEGEEVEGGEQISIYGTDLEFICGVELLDADGNPNLITEDLFYRKGTSSVIITVPKKNIYEGSFAGKVYTYDGLEFLMPELSYKPSQGGGHWETVKNVLWKNDGTKGVVDWGNVNYRFGLDGHDGLNECCATFPQEVWDLIKDGLVRVSLDCSGSSNVRVTTGWWSADYGGKEYNCMGMLQEEEDGTKFIELDIKGEGTIHDLIDEQHLLLTGSDYTPLEIYTLEEVWVEEEAGHWERKSLWKNDGTKGVVDWGNVNYRFGLDGHDGLNECCATFPQEVWDLIKDGLVRVALDCSGSSNVRVTTGWWSADYGGKEYNCMGMLQEEEDGTKFIELDIKGEGTIHDLIDEQHLLFTGSDYTPLEIYVNVWVEGDSAAPTEIVLWEGEVLADDWTNQPTLLSDAGPELVEAGAKAGQEVRFYATPTDANWKLKIEEGHWGGTWAAFCEAGTDTNNGEFTEVDLDANGGYIPLTLTDEILTAAFTQQWWGGVFIANGDNLKITKVTLF